MLNKRFDLIPIGYGLAQINIKNDHFFVKHPVGVSLKFNNCIFNKKLVINGHIHQAKVNNYNPDMNIYLPTLSDIMFETSGMSGFFKMNIECQRGYFVKVKLDHYIINCLKPIKVNEFNMQFNNGYEIEAAKGIQNERFVPILEKRALEQNEKPNSPYIIKPVSQIEKFNTRYKR